MQVSLNGIINLIARSDGAVAPAFQKVLTGPVGARSYFDGREHLFFGGTNYLGLANHWMVKLGSSIAVLKYGASVSASRTTTGTNKLHVQLEDRLSQFMSAEDACVCSSGSNANEVLLDKLMADDGVLICDQRVHPSLVQVPFQRTYFFRHADMDDLAQMLRGTRSNPAIVAVNGVDPLTGEIAPLDKILEVAQSREDVRIIVDDCHGFGVLGERGRGTPEHFGIHSDRVFQTSTLSKALGSYGGFIVGAKEFCGQLRASSSYVGATALPPSVVAASLIGIIIMKHRGNELRAKLADNSTYAASRLIDIGFKTVYYGTPILALSPPDGLDAEQLSSRLLENGIFLPFIRYPSKSSPGCLRMALSAAHTKDDIGELVDAVVRLS